jgi:hypothetical protein
MSNEEDRKARERLSNLVDLQRRISTGRKRQSPTTNVTGNQTVGNDHSKGTGSREEIPRNPVNQSPKASHYCCTASGDDPIPFEQTWISPKHAQIQRASEVEPPGLASRACGG